MSQEVRRVKTATEFQAAVDTGEIVEFEIAYAYVLRSDVSGHSDVPAAGHLRCALLRCLHPATASRRGLR